ncbi:MAG TPA: MFS transporter [Pyrinomonadaceae bacterium]|jgi:MFS family permease
MLIDITPLRISRDYRLLFFGQLVSFFGSMMSFIIVPWQMYELTKSNEMVGYIFLAQFVPMFFLAFVGGVLADSLDKRKMLRLTEIGQMIVTAILFANALLPEPHYWVLYVTVALQSALAALQRPAFESMIQKLFTADLMASVSALNSLRYQFGAIIAPAIAGVIVAQYGSSIAYGIDLVTFLASLVAVFLIRQVPSPEHADRPSLRSVIEGCRYAVSRQELLGTYLIDIIAMFFAMPQALYPALATIYGEEFLGVYPASMTIGMLIGSLTSGWTRNVQRHGFWVIISAALWGVGIIFFGLSDNIWFALVFLAGAGFADMISGIFRGAIWNQTIPYHLRGRLASIEMISYLTGPMLGSAKMGFVAERFGVKTAIVSGGVLCVVFVGILSLFLPKFFTYDGREGVRQKDIEEAERAELMRGSEAEF